MTFSWKILPLAALVMVTGCATIIDGGEQTLTFNSEPDGATITVAGKVVGKTPTVVSIDRDENLAFTFEKEGYKTHTGQLSTEMNGMFWGNILFGGVFGSTTDNMSGAIDEFTPDQYFITLTPKKPFGITSNKSRQIKEMMLGFGDDIRLELASSGGEKTDVILGIIQTEEGEKELRLITLKKLSDQNEGDLDFAKEIIEFYQIK